MSDYLVTSAELTETADAIRAKTGDANLIEWESGTGFAAAVAAIPSGGGGNAHYHSLTVTNTVDRNWIKFTHNLGVVPQIIRVRSLRNIDGEIATVPDDLALGEIAGSLVSVGTIYNIPDWTQYVVYTGGRNAANQRWGVTSGFLNLQSSMPPSDYAEYWDRLYATSSEVYVSSGASNWKYLAGITYFVELWG